MDDESDLKPALRWDDAEAGSRAVRHHVRRRDSTGSMSIRSVRSRREIDPAVALPIQYRTL